jgi:hypothetical protein
VISHLEAKQAPPGAQTRWLDLENELVPVLVGLVALHIFVTEVHPILRLLPPPGNIGEMVGEDVMSPMSTFDKDWFCELSNGGKVKKDNWLGIPMGPLHMRLV